MRIIAENDIQMKGVELDEKKGEKKIRPSMFSGRKEAVFGFGLMICIECSNQFYILNMIRYHILRCF